MWQGISCPLILVIFQFNLCQIVFRYFLLEIDPCMPCCLVSGPRLVKSNRFAAHNSSGICCSSILYHSSNIFSARRRSA
jgi:hypothetical protein